MRVLGWLRFGLVAGCCLLLLGGCSFNGNVNGVGKTLKVVTEPAFPPFEFIGKGGQPQGFSYDLIRAIASCG